MLEYILAAPTRYLLFTGKGGVGKTSISSAVAVALADRGARVLLVSTDPASNLSEVLGTSLGGEPKQVAGVDRLFGLDIDPLAAAAAYRERVVGPYRGTLPPQVIAGIEEQLSGSCTVEIAAFDQFTELLADPRGFDHVVFDTAPTGHTLRMLSLPGAWTSYLDGNQVGVTCVGPLAGLTQQRARYRAALSALRDSGTATLALVTRPDAGALSEASRASEELAAEGLTNQLLVLNGVFPISASEPAGDPVAVAYASRQRSALATMPQSLGQLPREEVCLQQNPPLGPAGLRSLLAPGDTPTAPRPGGKTDERTLEAGFEPLVESLVASRRGLVMTMGKGGVGKTTVAASLALAVARRGVPVVLSTTDPAAHLEQTLGDSDELPPALVVERIDPEAATAAYTAEVLTSAGARLEGSARDVLLEDLRSPCTQEIAVFREFAKTVARAEDRVVVLDTAPSGHTLLLLDAARTFRQEVSRRADELPVEVERLLDRLSDRDYTRVLVVTLAEPTPVHEAQALQEDLLRAGIAPMAWVINQSLLASATRDPLLAQIASHESRWFDVVRDLCQTVFVVPWQVTPPVGVAGLLTLAGQRLSGATRLAEPVPR